MRDTSLADAFSFAGGKFLAKALDGIVETIAARIGVGVAEELTYAEIRGALNLTEGMSKSASRRLIADIGMNGLKDKVINYVEIDGEKFVVNGNNRLIAAKRLGITDQLRFQKVNLPFRGFNSAADVFQANGEFVSGVRY